MKKLTCYLIALVMVAAVFFVPVDYARAAETDSSKDSLAKSNVTLSTVYYYYTGSQRKPIPRVKYDGVVLKKDIDYKVTYKNNLYPGKATVTVTGINDYKGTVSKNYYIAKVNGLETTSVGATAVNLKWEKQKNVTGYKLYKYNSNTKKWDMIKKLKGASKNYYSVEDLKGGYGYNFKVRAYVTKGLKTYHGSFSNVLSLPTRPIKATLTSLKADPRVCVTAKWKQQKASGYQVRISRYSNFKYSTTLTVKSSSATARKISNLTSDKTYYVKVRAYRTFEGRTTYGRWSESKKVKTYDTGWLYMANGERYYYKNGVSLKGAQKLDGKRYYFDTKTGELHGATVTMWNKVKEQRSDTNYLIAVSRDTHVVCVYKGRAGAWNVDKYYRCSTGAKPTVTPAGTYKLPTTRTHMKRFGAASGYSAWYATRIVGDVHFHSVLYQIGSKTAFVDGRLGLNISHGCIRMNINSAKWIYDNIPPRTKVIIY